MSRPFVVPLRPTPGPFETGTTVRPIEHRSGQHSNYSNSRNRYLSRNFKTWGGNSLCTSGAFPSSSETQSREHPIKIRVDVRVWLHWWTVMRPEHHATNGSFSDDLRTIRRLTRLSLQTQSEVAISSNKSPESRENGKRQPCPGGERWGDGVSGSGHGDEPDGRGCEPLWHGIRRAGG